MSQDGQTHSHKIFSVSDHFGISYVRELKNTLLANINLINHIKTRARSMEIASLHNSK